jgi:hypothetical protein
MLLLAPDNNQEIGVKGGPRVYMDYNEIKGCQIEVASSVLSF